MRKTCLDCVRKHLAQAHVLSMEAIQGYPEHRWLAMGHMAEASEECIADYSSLAMLIRDARILYQDEDVIPNYLMLVQEATNHANKARTSELKRVEDT